MSLQQRSVGEMIGVAFGAVALLVAAAPKPPHNGLIVFASNRGQDRGGEIYAVGPTGGTSTNLSRSSLPDLAPVVSPSGTRIAFVSERAGYRALYVEGVDGTGRLKLTDQTVEFDELGEPDLAWSPAEDAIALGSQVGLYIVPTEGVGAHLVAASGARPSWSADGQLLAFGADGNVTVVTRDGGVRWSRQGYSPQWSPKGAMLAFQAPEPNSPYTDLVVVDREGNQLATFPKSSAESWSPNAAWIGFDFTQTNPTYESQVSVAHVGEWKRQEIGPGMRMAWAPDSARLAYTHYGPNVLPLSARVSEPDGGNQLTLADNAGVIAWAPDGGRIALSDQTDVFAENGHHVNCGTVLTIRPDGKDLQRAVEPPANTISSWAGWADGGRIVYRRESGGSLFTIRPTGHPAKRLAADSGCGDSSPAWSPDGRSIAFVRAQAPSGFRSLYVRTAADSRAEPLGPGCCDDSSNPAWSPDGAAIAFDHGFHTIDLIRPADAQPAVLVSAADDLTWSPDGHRIAYIYRYGGIVSAPTETPYQSSQVAVGVEPAWSPNGRWIAYTRREGLRRAHPDGTADRPVISGPPGDLRSPAWSPDGKWIVYSKAGDLWLVRPDGRGLRRLTSGPAIDTAPSWQPVYG